MFKKIAKFVKSRERKFSFPTAVIIIAVAFIAVASAMADESAINKIIGEEIVEKSGVDNTVLLAADLDNFDLAMQITGALEDPPEIEDGNYYIDYQYKTLAIKDSVWQEVLYSKQMTVSKRSLDGRDLGLFVMEELGEIIDYQLAYLKEVQENEADKGITVILETTEYTGLIGLWLDTKTKELPGYEPVVKPIESEAVETVAEEPPLTPPWLGGEDYPDEEIPPAAAVGLSPSAEETGELNYPNEAAYWEQVKNNCLNNGGFWYNETCNAKEEPPLVPPSEGGEETVAEELIPADEEEPVVEEPPVEEEPVSEEPTDETPAEEEAPTEDPAEEPEPVDEPDPVDEDPTEEEPAGEPTEETEDSTSSE